MEEKERQEVFRGSLKECFRHLIDRLTAQAPKGSRESTTLKKPIADFCGVGVPTITRWLQNDASLPNGEVLIKLMCCLHIRGYAVVELEKMHRNLRNLAELIGFGIFSAEEVANLLGYTTSSTVFQAIWGHHGVSEDKDRKIWEAWKSKKEELAQRKADVREAYRNGVAPDTRPTRTEAMEAQGAPATYHTVVPPSAVICIMQGLLGMVDENFVGSISDEDLDELRPAAGTILRLAARLSILGSKLMPESPGGRSDG